MGSEKIVKFKRRTLWQPSHWPLICTIRNCYLATGQNGRVNRSGHCKAYRLGCSVSVYVEMWNLTLGLDSQESRS